MNKIILASASPRRKKLLEQAGIRFNVDHANIDETINPQLTPLQFVKKLSLQKAKLVAKKYKKEIIIAADTIIALGKVTIGKPKDKKDAVKILKLLSGKMHFVITAFTIINTQTKKIITQAVKTKVFFKKITAEEISKYLLTAKILDKAGAYAIQEEGGSFVKKTVGDYTNIIGLPIKPLLKELNKLI